MEGGYLWQQVGWMGQGRGMGKERSSAGSQGSKEQERQTTQTLRVSHRSVKTYLDKTQNASDPEDADYPEKCWADGEVGEDIMEEYAHDGCKHQDKVKQVPRYREVVMAQANDLDYGFC